MSKLFIPVGIPGCGKTTLATSVLRHNGLLTISTDDIRAEYVKAGKLESVNDMSMNKAVFAKFYKRIEDKLLDYNDVFADATNLRASDRKKLKQIADRVGAETHVFVFTNLMAAILGNKKRDRTVPADVMVKMLENYERSLREIPTEGYATVTYIESMA